MSATLADTWDFESGTLPFRQQLQNCALRLTRSIEDSEDLVQDTYLRAFKYYERFKDGTNLRAWLFRIMKNVFINSYRRKLRTARVVSTEYGEEGGPRADLPANDSDPEQICLDSVLDPEVRNGLMGLAEEYRRVIVLSDIEGYSYSEIAGREGIPQGTVMSRLYRGRRLLERALLSYGRRYNYLRQPPERLRDRRIDVGEYFDTAA